MSKKRTTRSRLRSTIGENPWQGAEQLSKDSTLNSDIEQIIGKPRQRVAGVTGRAAVGARKTSTNVALVAIADSLEWQFDHPLSTPVLSGRRGGPGVRSAVVDEGAIVTRTEVPALEPNEFLAYLGRIDDQFTPPRTLGLRAVTRVTRGSGATFQLSDKIVTAPAAGRLLLLVHGTFSNSANTVNSFQTLTAGGPNYNGREFLDVALREYGAGNVLAFGHRTLSVSPMINALDLAETLRDCKAEIDVICHSRGGLVTRWWSEAFDVVPNRNGSRIFVGSPLHGTSLASPARLKRVADLLASFANALNYGAKLGQAVGPVAAPIWIAAQTLLGIIKFAMDGLAKTPILDAGVAVVPGLGGQSAVSNNSELNGLRTRAKQSRSAFEDYYFIRSNFQSDEIGWRFWRAFTKMGQRAANAAADYIFPADNDLVVDSDHMDDVYDDYKVKSSQILDFKTNPTVHHLNYFDQEKTISFFRNKLRI